MAKSFGMVVTPSNVVTFLYILSKRLEAAQIKSHVQASGTGNERKRLSDDPKACPTPGCWASQKNTSQPLHKQRRALA